MTGRDDERRCLIFSAESNAVGEFGEPVADATALMAALGVTATVAGDVSCECAGAAAAAAVDDEEGYADAAGVADAANDDDAAAAGAGVADAKDAEEVPVGVAGTRLTVEAVCVERRKIG